MICFDTQLLIWGVQGVATLGQESMIGKTKKFIDHLTKKGIQVFVPAPAVYEYLVGFEPGEQKKQRAIVEKQFRVPAFDLPSAEIAAEIMANKPVVQKARNDFAIRRQACSVDAQIIGVAIFNKATTIYTNDIGHFSVLAGNRIKVCEVPEVLNQDDLF